jgi:hypothetical protein
LVVATKHFGIILDTHSKQNSFLEKGEEFFVYYGQSYVLERGTAGYYKRPHKYQSVTDDVVERVFAKLGLVARTRMETLSLENTFQDP